MSVAFDYDASAVLVLAVLNVTAHSFQASYVTIHIRSTTERPADEIISKFSLSFNDFAIS